MGEGWGKGASAAGATRELKSVARKALKASDRRKEVEGNGSCCLEGALSSRRLLKYIRIRNWKGGALHSNLVA